jgi:hypothetical protein
MPRLPQLLLIVSLGGLLGCAPKAARPPPETAGDGPGRVGSTTVGSSPVDRGLPARLLGGVGAGVLLTLPDGWTARRVDDGGAVVAVAYGPPEGGVKLELRRWDGDPASVAVLMASDPWAWSATGPYAAIEAADGDPLVATFRESVGEDPSRDVLGLGWFFLVQGRGVGVVARVPATRLESGFRDAWGVVGTARPPEDS